MGLITRLDEARMNVSDYCKYIADNCDEIESAAFVTRIAEILGGIVNLTEDKKYIEADDVTI